MQACSFSDKESEDAREQMLVCRTREKATSAKRKVPPPNVECQWLHKTDGGQQRSNQPTKGSAKMDGGGSGNSNSSGSIDNSNVTARQQCNGDGDGQ